VPAAEREAAHEHKRSLIGSLPTDRFPRLRDGVSWLIDCEDTEAYFTFGTEFFLAGVQNLQRRLTS
jgi:TetR/AcrR family tetracycline transcriptional repressor